MGTRLGTLVVWALVAAAAAFWGLRLFGGAQPVPPGTQLATAQGAPGGDLTRLLGTDPEPVAAVEAPQAAPDPRFQLVGVVSPRAAGAAAEGLAVIVVDDKPARAYRIGAVVDGQTVLQSVSPRGASLGPRGGTALVSLDLPPPAAAATGQMPPLAAGGYRPPPVPQVPQPNFQGLAGQSPPVLQPAQATAPGAPRFIPPQGLPTPPAPPGQTQQPPQGQPTMVDRANAPLR